MSRVSDGRPTGRQVYQGPPFPHRRLPSPTTAPIWVLVAIRVLVIVFWVGGLASLPALVDLIAGGGR